MKKFLENVADKIIEVCKQGSLKTLVIIPNKRSEIFLKYYIKKRINGPFWLPDFLTVDEFMINISGISNINPLFHYFELYKIHQQITGDKQKSLEEFLSWAPIMLSDFNDIDLYQADAESVFKHLSAAKVLEKWNLGEKPLTDFETNYLNFYQSLYAYYSTFNKNLKAKNSGYKGMIYRFVAENISEILQNKSWDHFVVAGLNALSTAEKQVFSYLNSNYTVDFLWDADEYYMNPEKGNEAGRYIREMIKEWNLQKVQWIDNNLLDESGKEIRLIGISKNIGQVKYTGQLIKSLFDTEKMNREEIEANMKETAVVLADENLLVPLLNSLPQIELTEPDGSKKNLGYNITMGYPVKNSPVNLFVNQWLEMHIRKAENSNHKFAVLQLLALLKNPTLQLVFTETDNQHIEQFTENVKYHNYSYLTKDEILKDLLTANSEKLSFMVELLLSSAVNTLEFIDYLIRFLHFAKTKVKEIRETNVLAYEQFNSLVEVVKQLHSLPIQDTELISLKALQKIFVQITRRNEITLRGEPLNGIQVMGMLETRTLDFRHVVLLSANEGVLPKTDNFESFLPFDIRHEYHLPLPQDKNDVFAYHFYRLIQRAEQVTLIYNSEAGVLGGGEPSRYILQLKNELAKVNSAIKISDQYLSIPAEITKANHQIVIQKDDNVMKLIREKAKAGLSPSALNNYIACPLRFYFSNILKIRPQTEVEENVESDIFGSVVHGVFEEIYKPFVGKQISQNVLKEKLNELSSILERQFQSEFKGGNISSGKNLLLVKVAEKYIQQFIEDDIERTEKNSPVLLGVEEIIETLVEVEGIEVKLSGVIDRIEKDAISNSVQVIDYKTGKVMPAELKLKNWEELLQDTKWSKAFQLLFYVFVYYAKNKENQNIEAGIYSMRSLSSGLLKLAVPENESDISYLEKFEEILLSLISDILNPQVPFSQTDDLKRCEWCDFKAICNR